jgi:TRAP-type C4-dicarboxylate transport system substrate-binding protein
MAGGLSLARIDVGTVDLGAEGAELMRKLIADAEEDQIKKLQAAGMLVTRPDLAPFRARMEPAYKRIAAYAGEANVKKFRDLVEQGRKGA